MQLFYLPHPSKKHPAKIFWFWFLLKTRHPTYRYHKKKCSHILPSLSLSFRFFLSFLDFLDFPSDFFVSSSFSLSRFSRFFTFSFFRLSDFFPVSFSAWFTQNYIYINLDPQTITITFFLAFLSFLRSLLSLSLWLAKTSPIGGLKQTLTKSMIENQKPYRSKSISRALCGSSSLWWSLSESDRVAPSGNSKSCFTCTTGALSSAFSSEELKKKMQLALAKEEAYSYLSDLRCFFFFLPRFLSFLTFCSRYLSDRFCPITFKGGKSKSSSATGTFSKLSLLLLPLLSNWSEPFK